MRHPSPTLPMLFLLLAACGDKSDTGDTAPSITWEPITFMSAVEQNRYVEDLEFIAQERVPGSDHWQAVQDLCAQRFESLGYQVELHDYGSGVNVIGVRQGGARAGEQVLVSAHYDHISGCPGADDNGSGVAGVMEAARVLAAGDWPRTLVVACWDEEERGLIGSTAWATRAHEQGDTISANLVFEMIGVKKTEPDSQEIPAGLGALFPEEIQDLADHDFVGDFIALIYDTQQSGPTVEAMATLAEGIGLRVVGLGLDEEWKNSPATGTLRRSDHAPFWSLDYPGVMISDTSEYRYAQYHCRDGDDVVANLDMDFAYQVVQATVGAGVEMLTAE